MRQCDNRRIVRETSRDNWFSTVGKVTQQCGFQRAMGLHYVRGLYLAGLMDGFEVTCAGLKMLQDEQLTDSDDDHCVDIRVSEAQEHRAE